jgi:hypothetical protein
MGKIDKYNKMVMDAIVSGTPLPAAKVRQLAQYGLSESQIQQSCIRWFQVTHPQLWKDGVLFHIANERKCTQWQGRKLKLEGVVKGVADLCLAVARKGFNALYIEMKKPGSYQEKEQKEWQSGVEKHGNRYVVCKSLDEFEKIVTDYLKES